jgi:hypothetical protein
MSPTLASCPSSPVQTPLGREGATEASRSTEANRLCLPEQRTAPAAAMPYKDPEKARLNQRRYRQEHKEAVARSQRRYYEENRDRKNVMRQRNRRGVTRARFEALWEAQQGVCANPGCQASLYDGAHVDHDHACCPRPTRPAERAFAGCSALTATKQPGLLGDDIVRVRGLADYLAASHLSTTNGPAVNTRTGRS